MNDIEELKRRKLEEMQREQENSAKMQQEIAQAENLAKSFMTKEALERYGNIKMAYPDRAMQTMGVILNLVQQGQIKQVDDNTLKEILRIIEPKKKDINIKRI